MSIEKFKECVDTKDILGAVLAIQSLSKLNKNYNELNTDTPLVYATRYNSAIVVEALIQVGASVDTRSTRDWNALHVASMKGHTDVVKLLLESGADIAQPCVAKWTALHIASFHGHIEVVKLLLEADASTKARTDEGQTALDLATEEEHDTVVELLRSHKRTPVEYLL